MEKEKSNKSNKWIGFAVLIIIAIGMIFLVKSDGIKLVNNSSEVLASVNGVEIDRDSYNVLLEQSVLVAAQQGVNIEENEEDFAILETEILDRMIGSEILYQQSMSTEIAKSFTDVEESYNAILEAGGGEEAYMELLEERGFGLDDLKSDLVREASINAVIESILVDQDFTVSSEEVQTLYDQVAETNPAVPPLDDVYGEVESQIAFGKEQSFIGEYVLELRSEAEVELFI